MDGARTNGDNIQSSAVEPIPPRASPYTEMTRRWRPLTRLEWQFAAGLAILIWCACSPPRPTPLNFSGAWQGTTSQGRPIAFTVSADLRITNVTLDYAFAGCSGRLTIPADVPLLNTSATAAAVVMYTPNGPAGPSRTTVRFLFPTIASANGTVEFVDYSTCGSTSANWTATK